MGAMRFSIGGRGRCVAMMRVVQVEQCAVGVVAGERTAALHDGKVGWCADKLAQGRRNPVEAREEERIPGGM